MDLTDDVINLSLACNEEIYFATPHLKLDGGIEVSASHNPMIVGNQKPTSDAVIQHAADFGLAWDGDFDRCFFFDEKGQFIEGYYIVGLLAEAFLQKNPGQQIVHDPRLTWNTIDIVRENGGIPVHSKCGHAYIKQVMREQDAIYGGEMSVQHYFRDFSYCDSGMISCLLIAELLSLNGQPLSNLVESRIFKFPSSGEINRTIADADQSIKRVEDFYQHDASIIDKLGGISMEFPMWRFNLHKLNTEPLVRLNVE